LVVTRPAIPILTPQEEHANVTPQIL